jgi:polyphosphate kinase 2 (PPK2 family)
VLDNLDEVLEMELDDENFGALLDDRGGQPRPGGSEAHGPGSPPNPRAVYFRELIRLQSELVKLQDWVMSNGLKVVVLFEGRDAAGKGGVIKRIT